MDKDAILDVRRLQCVLACEHLVLLQPEFSFVCPVLSHDGCHLGYVLKECLCDERLLMAQFFRYPEAQVFAFDKGYSALPLAAAAGGHQVAFDEESDHGT